MIHIMELKHTILLLLLQQIVSAYQASASDRSRAIVAEKAILLAFKSTITSDPQAALANWLESNDACNFTGVRCNRWHLHVSKLQLNRTEIQGTVSPYLANLTRLHELDLSDNQLTGHIPRELSSLRKLTALQLSGNYLEGQIPESFSFLSSLSYLNLGGNQLTGQIPASIISNCTYLSVVDLSDNALSGEIPSDIGNNLPYLYYLNLYLNYFTGKIPSSLSNSSFLDLLDVENNHLSGELPTGVVWRLTHLRFLHLSYNYLSSQDNNTNLEPFFYALSNCSGLEELEIAGNGLSGHLPRRVGRLTLELSAISLEDNKIFGQIPPDIANLSNLVLLNLSSNLFSGTIPEEISLLPMLLRLVLSNNLLTGAIPSTLGNINSMGLLDLSKNKLSGEIPRSLGNLSGLSKLFLQKNELSGAIPSSLGQCKDMNILDLSYNRLEGDIPQEISGVAKIYFNLSNNQLQGSLPSDLSKMQQVQEIDLSSNNLTGEIIQQISNCVAVQLINLSHNSLQGPLPGTFGSLQNLECLDVSYNSLSGEIPLSLSKCTRLTRLNFSFNDFSGSIPLGGFFSSLTDHSFLGNPHLCGSASAATCSKKKRWQHSPCFLIMMCVMAIILASVLMVCFVIGVRKIKGILMSTSDDVFGVSSLSKIPRYPRITYRELDEATRRFDQESLIGSGSYGRVYKGTLNDGTVIAVKVLQLQTGYYTKSFNRECQVLKRIRHRNLMRIITACSLPDFKAVILPFMANGSLESHLYLDSGSSDLSLVQRVSICSDIAEGIAYLHHYSPVRVIHCDLKPSNVLLNDDMTALVSDFGISRLVMPVGMTSASWNYDEGNSTANILCGSIGYIAPEYGVGLTASTKGDVYSFGVVVLEIITRRRPTDEMFESGLNLHKWVKAHYLGRVETLVDSLLMSVVRDQTPEVKKMWQVAIGEMLELGILCTQENPSLRPTMLDAADDLDRLKSYLMGDITATFASSLGASSSAFGED